MADLRSTEEKQNSYGTPNYPACSVVKNKASCYAAVALSDREEEITPFGRDPFGGGKLNAPLLRRTVHFWFISLVRFAHRFAKQKMPRNGALSAES